MPLGWRIGIRGIPIHRFVIAGELNDNMPISRRRAFKAAGFSAPYQKLTTKKIQSGLNHFHIGGVGFWVMNVDLRHLTEAGTKIQHILYKPEDVDLLIKVLNKAEIQINDAWCLFVIGHYSGRISYPENISLFVKKMEEHKINLDWAICAFGKEEMSCLEKAISLGGKIRVGFENSLFMPNGEIASDNHIKVDAVNKLFQLN